MTSFAMPSELADIIATHRALFGGFVMEAGNGGNDDGETPPATGFTPITSQADLDRIIGERVRRAKPADYDEVRAKAAKLDEIEESGKTELQKATDRIAALEAAKQQLEADMAGKDHDLLRERVARDKGVPAHRITGTTESELKADADRYLSETKRPYVVPPMGTGAPPQGAAAGRERAQAYLKKHTI